MPRNPSIAASRLKYPLPSTSNDRKKSLPCAGEQEKVGECDHSRPEPLPAWRCREKKRTRTKVARVFFCAPRSQDCPAR